MLALRDQENLVNAHQTAAAAKALNQGAKQLGAKTPGNKAPKTPFKIPLNDENDNNILGGGKGLKGVGKGNENLQTGGKKSAGVDRNAFVTPMGPRSRAPLGQKTTNAKAKGQQTPAPNAGDNDLGKTVQKSATSRKPRPRVSHAEMVKVDVLADNDLEEREIEYMPPRAKDLPDIPDDLPELNLSMFEGDITRDCFRHYYNRPGPNGMSIAERREKEMNERHARLDARTEALIMRDVENVPLECIHVPECGGEECKDEPERRRQHEEKYNKILAALEEPSPSTSASPPKRTMPNTKPKSTKTSGPNTLKSKLAATSLCIPASEPRPQVAAPSAAAKPAAKFPASILAARTKKPAVPASSNTSPMRHAVAVRASNTTIGYTKGAALRKTVLPLQTAISTAASRNRTAGDTSLGNTKPQQLQRQFTKPALRQALAPKDPNKKPAAEATTKPKISADSIPDTTLPPALYLRRYGTPPVGSAMWVKCKRYGCFDEEEDDASVRMGSEYGAAADCLEDDWSEDRAVQEMLMQEAEVEFELALPDF